MVSLIEQLFPKLSSADYQITSPNDARYNCIAWAAGDTQRWWWPEQDPENGYWPEGVPAVVTVDAFVAAFATLGYEPCDQPDYEPNFERIALFADEQGTPTHVARQLPSGRWTSKLGKLEDIEHDLNDLVGSTYGSVVQVLKRALPAVRGN